MSAHTIANQLHITDQPGSVAAIGELLARCTVQHHFNPSHGVRQMLVVTCPHRVKHSAAPKFGYVAKAYVELTTGEVVARECAANPAAALDVQLRSLDAILGGVHLSSLPSSALLSRALNNISCALLSLAPHRVSREMMRDVSELVAQLLPSFDIQSQPVSGFLQGLDGASIALINELREGYPRDIWRTDVYNLLAANDPIANRNRVQAVRVLPWLLDVLVPQQTDDAANIHIAKSPHREAILHIIDQGQPLLSSLAALFGVPRETVQWSKGRIFHGIAPFSPDQFLQLLASITREKRPQTEDECIFIVKIARTITSLLTPHDHQMDVVDLNALSAQPCVVAFIADRLKDLEHIPKLRKGHHWLQILTHNAIKFLAALDTACVRCEVHPCETVTVPKPQLFLYSFLRYKSLERIEKMSKNWHRRVQQEAERMVRFKLGASLQLVEESAWPMLLAQPITIGKTRFEELGNEAALRIEGDELEHCVGGYAFKCQGKLTVVFSLKTQEPCQQARATLSLAIDADESSTSRRVSIDELKGIRNSALSAEHLQVAHALVNRLNGGEYRAAIQQRIDYRAYNNEIEDQTCILMMVNSEPYQQVSQRIATACMYV
jgi:hypothetical protein